jgi:hypothetical protein
MNINYKKKNTIKINNLKLARYLEVILKEEFTTKVITILDMYLIVCCENFGFVQSNLFTRCLHFLFISHTLNTKF